MERSVYRRLDELEGGHWWFLGRRAILHAVIARVFAHKQPIRVLEAGCGTGGNLRMLSHFGTVEAFEMDDEARQIAAGKLPIDVKPGLLPHGIPPHTGDYDLVAALDVLEHVEQDVESLRELAGHLSPDGLILITVPAHPWMWSEHDVVHHHFRRYTRESLRSTIRSAGLVPEEICYFNVLLFPLIAGVRLLKKLGGGKGSSDDAMPPAPLNTLLAKLFGFERHLIGRVPMPAGVSLLAVIRRPG